MTFVKGQSGNPAGRALKGRALTEILERAGNATIAIPGQAGRTARKQLTARLAWEGATTGRVTFADDPEPRVLPLDAADWIGLVKWIYSQVDGPPPAGLDVTTLGQRLEVPVTIVEVVAPPAPDAP